VIVCAAARCSGNGPDQTAAKAGQPLPAFRPALMMPSVDTARMSGQYCWPGRRTCGIVAADHPDHLSDLARLLPVVAD
jgi:hypothetical protein